MGNESDFQNPHSLQNFYDEELEDDEDDPLSPEDDSEEELKEDEEGSQEEF